MSILRFKGFRMKNIIPTCILTVLIQFLGQLDVIAATMDEDRNISQRFQDPEEFEEYKSALERIYQNQKKHQNDCNILVFCPRPNNEDCAIASERLEELIEAGIEVSDFGFVILDRKLCKISDLRDSDSWLKYLESVFLPDDLFSPAGNEDFEYIKFINFQLDKTQVSLQEQVGQKILEFMAWIEALESIEIYLKGDLTDESIKHLQFEFGLTQLQALQGPVFNMFKKQADLYVKNWRPEFSRLFRGSTISKLFVRDNAQVRVKQDVLSLIKPNDKESNRLAAKFIFRASQLQYLARLKNPILRTFARKIGKDFSEDEARNFLEEIKTNNFGYGMCGVPEARIYQNRIAGQTSSID